jgi:lipopolysaccharide biosynthesis regulator YciM
MGMEYRSAAYTELAKIYFKEKKFDKAIDYIRKSIDFNHYAIDAYQLLAVISRLKADRDQATRILDTLLQFDPLNHFAAFEKYQWDSSRINSQHLVGMIRNEMPQQTFLEMAIWYYNLGRKDESEKILALAPATAEIKYWLAFLKDHSLSTEGLHADLTFPFRPETAEVLKALIPKNDSWLLKYHLALLQWSYNNIDSAKKLFDQCGELPDYAPFYAARAKFYMIAEPSKVLADLQRARDLNPNDWRYGKAIINYYFNRKQYDLALATAKEYKKRFSENYIIGMLYARALILNAEYTAAAKILQEITILPNEGATDGRQLYEETQLMLALDAMQKKNYRLSLHHIEAARQWPENLGVGKPYASDIDERLEDWLAYQSYLKLNNEKSADEEITKIITYTMHNSRDVSPSTNDLISAWALEKKESRERAEEFLDQQLRKNPDNRLSQWAVSTYQGKNSPLAEEASGNYKVLQQWITIQHL